MGNLFFRHGCGSVADGGAIVLNEKSMDLLHFSDYLAELEIFAFMLDSSILSSHNI